MKKNNDYIIKKVKYEFFNEKGEQNFSKEYEVKLSLNPNDIEENNIIILNTCNFKTKEERVFYRIFDQKYKNIFIGNSRLLEYIKNQENNPIIMKNCTIYAKEIIDKLKEAILKLNDKSKKEEISYNKFRITLRYLSVNFEEDLFSEEFIKYEGIKYLISLIRNSSGNIRTYALNGLSKLLDFLSGYEYIKKQKKETFEMLIRLLINAENIKTNIYILDIFIKFIHYNNEDSVLFIDEVEKLEKNLKIPIFSSIIKMLTSSHIDRLNQLILILFNSLLLYSGQSEQMKLLNYLEEAGIYNALENISKIKGNYIQEQLKIFSENKNRIIKGFSNEIKYYKMKIEDLKNKNKIIEEELKNEKQKNKILNQKIIDLNNIINENKKVKKEIGNVKEQDNDNNYLRKIIELTDEIKELKFRFPFEISKEDKLIIISFISDDESIHYSLLCKNTEYFAKAVNNFYKEYPEFRKSKNIFMNKGKSIIEYETLEFNDVKNNDIITVRKLDDIN